LGHIATLPPTPALRREQIKHQVALANAVMHVRGYAAPETKSAFQQARSFIERAEELGENPNDRLLLFWVLYGIWAANSVAFDGDALMRLGSQFMSLAAKQDTRAPISGARREQFRTLAHPERILRGPELEKQRQLPSVGLRR
jgi:hypothetical protein